MEMVFWHAKQKTIQNELYVFNLLKIDTQNKICQIEAATEQRYKCLHISRK